MPPEVGNVEALAEKIRRGETISAEDTRTVFKTADAAGLLYYQMLTMVREQRSLSELPATLKEIIKTGAWRKWRWVGLTFGQNSLGAYLTSPPPNGVGIQLDIVEKLIEGDPEAERLYREATTAKHGGDRTGSSKSDNITLEPKRGTSRAYTLDRLKRKRPDLYERVKAKELTASAAARLAGWRKSPPPLIELRRAWRRASDEERATFRSEVLA